MKDDILIDMTTGETYTGDKSWAEAYNLSNEQLSRMGLSTAELCIVLMTRKQREALRQRKMKGKLGKRVLYPVCHSILTSEQRKRLRRVNDLVMKRASKKQKAQKIEDYIKSGIFRSTKVQK